MLKSYQRNFINFALNHNVLRFGEFKLKSGRLSPYFFNAGNFNTGTAMAQLGHFYASAIIDQQLEFDVLFGPAYKGIPLAVATAIALANEFKRDTPLCFNRKEAKDHGEGGQLVGAALSGKVLIIDDVITAGTAVGESAVIIANNKATLNGIIIALNRQERGNNEYSAIDEVQQRYHCQVASIITFEDLIDYLSEQPERGKELEQMRAYQLQYRATAAY